MPLLHKKSWEISNRRAWDNQNTKKEPEILLDHYLSLHSYSEKRKVGSNNDKLYSLSIKLNGKPYNIIKFP